MSTSFTARDGFGAAGAPVGGSIPLAEFTTLGLGGPAAAYRRVATTEDLVSQVAAADRAGAPLLILGGGSNVVVDDAGFPGTVVHVASRGVAASTHADRVALRAQAGEEWAPFVHRCVLDGLSGIEALAGIPGRVGATPIQNVGAYGQEVAETITEVVVYDRRERRLRRLTGPECGFTYRSSIFKGDDRFVVCEVEFALTPSAFSAPVAYPELARALDVAVGERAELAAVHEAVLSLRRGKGMVIDPGDADTRSAGSFFTNPVLSPLEFARLRDTVRHHCGEEVEPPAFPQPDGTVKTSAAWLIDRAGFAKGYGSGPARISTKHTLALTNRGGATTADLLDLAREVRDGVAAVFDVTLVPEPVLVGARL